MAINYGDYARIQGQTTDFSPLAQGVQSALANNKERIMRGANAFAQTHMQKMMNPFEKLAYSDVNTWSPQDLSILNKSAGQALREYQSSVMAANPKYYNILAEAGQFNPIDFKANYDGLKAQYSPFLERKLQSFQQKNNWTDKHMQLYIGRNPQLQSYILDNASPDSPLRALAKPYVPSGFLGGMAGEFGKDPLRYGMSLGGAQAIAGGYRGAKSWKDFKGFGEGAWKGLQRGYMPFGSPSKGLRNIYQAAVTAPGSAQSKAFKDRYMKKLNANVDKLDKHVSARNRLFKKQTGIKWADATDKQIKDWSRRSSKKHAAGGRGKYSKLTPKAINDKIQSYTTRSKELTKKLQGGVNKSADLIKRYQRRYGNKALLSAATKSLGSRKMAGQLVGRALAAIGGAALNPLSLAMSAWTLYDLAQMLKAGAKETPKTGNISKLLVGGGTPISPPSRNYMSDEDKAEISRKMTNLGF